MPSLPARLPDAARRDGRLAKRFANGIGRRGQRFVSDRVAVGQSGDASGRRDLPGRCRRGCLRRWPRRRSRRRSVPTDSQVRSALTRSPSFWACRVRQAWWLCCCCRLPELQGDQAPVGHVDRRCVGLHDGGGRGLRVGRRGEDPHQFGVGPAACRLGDHGADEDRIGQGAGQGKHRGRGRHPARVVADDVRRLRPARRPSGERLHHLARGRDGVILLVGQPASSMPPQDEQALRSSSFQRVREERLAKLRASSQPLRGRWSLAA